MTVDSIGDLIDRSGELRQSGNEESGILGDLDRDERHFHLASAEAG